MEYKTKNGESVYAEDLRYASDVPHGVAIHWNSNGKASKQFPLITRVERPNFGGGSTNVNAFYLSQSSCEYAEIERLKKTADKYR